MSTASLSVVQYGRRKGSSKEVMKTVEESSQPIQLPDLRQVTVLPRAEWLRIQDNLKKVNQYNESLIEASKRREALHLRSKEVVKNWSNTIAGQRQRKLKAKKIREEIEEEQRKQIDIEEAEYQEQRRKKAIEKARAQLYYQTDIVKGFNSALLLTEVLKEREAQIELKQKIKKASKDVDKEIMETLAHKEEESLKQEQEKALQRRKEREALSESLKQQIKEHQLATEREKMEEAKEAEELKRLRELHLLEQSMREQRRQEEKRNMMRAHSEHLANRDIIRAIEAQKQEVEEERRRLFVQAKDKMMKLRKEKEAEIFREVQKHREAITDKLAGQQQEQASNEEELIARAVAERDARLARKQQQEDKKQAEMLKSITDHRKATDEQRKQKEQEEKQKSLEMLLSKKEADRVFLEKQQQKAQKMREMGKVLQDMYIHQMAEKQARTQRVHKEHQEFEAKNAQLVIEDMNQFQEYAKHLIDAAARAGRNTFPLRKAARMGIGGGLGPVFGGVRPSYLVQDESGVQMPSYIGGTTQSIKELNETADIQKSKKRLGFNWSSGSPAK
ncbi:coiled-coil domain-containing protein 173 [Chanos chanos]|uniref:Coiled-coil domain-containing protein 173 n=1 Tax=Chanos chanos TaxID=29144 RepID=A0A6J2WAY2_CHACN|nr:coiled-coil domain-containing protein 173 [Chanos chanos]